MKAKAYVDGSYNASTKVHGAGAVLFFREDVDPIPLSQPGNHPAFIGSRNVTGEAVAATLVIEARKKIPDLEELTLYHDYAGIECWVKGSWRANTALSWGCRDAVKDLPFKLSPRKVKARTGGEYSEAVDKFAKQACGL